MNLEAATGWWLAPTVAVATVACLWWHQTRRAWLPEDHPTTGRKDHGVSTPMVGRVVALALAGWFGGRSHAGADLSTGLLAIAVAVAAGVGFEDDRRKDRAGREVLRTGDPAAALAAELPDGLDWRAKAVGLGISSTLVAAAVAVGPAALSLWDLTLVCLGAFAVTNAVNFLDNRNGVAALVVAAPLLVAAAAAEPPLALAGAGWIALGFLPVNWPNGRWARGPAFLGDCGALALGTALAGCAVTAPPAMAGAGPWFAVALVAVPLLDFTQVILVRLWLAIPPWSPDRRHITHLLENAGVPPPLVAPVLALAGAGAAALACALL